MKPSFAIVGGGRVGTALGQQLCRLGYRCTGVSCKSRESSQKASSTMGRCPASTSPWEITVGANIVFITTPDSVIAEVCEKIDSHGGFSAGSTVFHCSGALPSTIMRLRGKTDISCGSIHPLQSFARQLPQQNPFEGIVLAVEGDQQAVQIAKAVADDLGGICLTIKTEAKPLYHAAAVVASNYLVTLFDIAFSLLEESGIDRGNAVATLWPLVMGTLKNIETVGIPSALTGPVSRGDTRTVEMHLKEITRQKPDLAEAYRLLGLYTIDVAIAGNMISKKQAQKLKTLLDKPGLH